MRIGIDLDGVCYHWERTARYLLRERLPNSPYTKDGPLGRTSTHWDYIPDNVSNAHWTWLWTWGVKEGLFRHGHIIKGAVEGLKDLAADGHDLIVITHRPKQAVNDTLQWLSYLNVPLSGVHILTQEEPKSEIPCEIYVDDKPENVVDYTLNTEAKLVALFDQPWNQKMQTLPVASYRRVCGWPEFVKEVRSIK